MAWAVLGSLQRAAALILGVAGVASVARAEPDVPERDWLRWQGPSECQNTREVERQIESLLGRAPDLAQLPPTRVEIGWAAERGWTLRIRVSLPHGERRREVDVRTCMDGFDVVALTLALILDPDLQTDAALDAEPPPEGAAANGVAAPQPSSELETEVDPTSLGAPQGSAARAAMPSDRAGAPSGTAPRGSTGSPALALGGNARVDLGSLPATLFGGGLELSLSAAQWRLDTGGAFLARGGESLPTARYPVSYTNVLGLLRGCREFMGERGGNFGLCLGGQLGSLAASEAGGEHRRARGLWAALNLGAELGIGLTEGWGAFSRVELVFPLIQHQLELTGGAVVFELPTVSVQLTLGAVVKLTDWAAP